MKINATSEHVKEQTTPLATVVIDLDEYELPDGNRPGPTIVQIRVENAAGLNARFFLQLRKVRGRIQAQLVSKRMANPGETVSYATADWML